MVHHYRNTQPALAETYGIVTDGLRWLFFFIGKEDKVCTFLMPFVRVKLTLGE
jgi:hypothetical protein